MIQLLPTVLGVWGLLLIAEGLREVRRSGIGSGILIPLVSVISLAVLIETRSFGGQAALSAAAAVVVLGSLLPLLRSHWKTVADAKVPSSVWFLGLLGAWLFFVDAARNPDISTVQTVGRLLCVIVWFTMALILSVGIIERSHLLVVSFLGSGMVLVLTAAWPMPWRACDQFKCSPAGALLTGPFPSENFLARFLCLCFLLALLAGISRSRALIFGSMILLVVVATSSRSTLAALIGALLVVVLARRLSSPLLLLAALVSSVGAALLGTYLVYTAGPSFLSNRGTIWTIGRSALGEDWLVGLGVDRWSTVYQQNFMHSQILFLLFSGGAVALGLFVCLLVALVGNAERAQRAPLLACLSFVLMNSFSEVTWNILAVDGTSLVLLALFGLANIKRQQIGKEQRYDAMV